MLLLLLHTVQYVFRISNEQIQNDKPQNNI